jgi:hypothetical protein
MQGMDTRTGKVMIKRRRPWTAEDEEQLRRLVEANSSLTYFVHQEPGLQAEYIATETSASGR